ncbi:MAG: hydrogenase maturation protease [Chloroflexia bacterium]|nr:hydrogenase maturation protease [Chloroflexia bacterium]
MATLVLGLGNPILTDDAVGIRAAEAVQAALVQRDDALPLAEVATASVGGLALMEAMIGYDRVVLIDAFCCREPSPGRIHRLTLEDLAANRATVHSASSHDTRFETALALGRQMGFALPNEIIIYAIEVTNVVDFSEQITPAVARAIPQTIHAILSELLPSNLVRKSTEEAHYGFA